MIEIAYQRITKPEHLGYQYADKDGLGLWEDEAYHIHDCIIDMSQCNPDDVDESFSVTYGSSAFVERCVIRGAGKLILCGSGDENVAETEKYKTVEFDSCILEDFGRRGPEVQAGMQVVMRKCLIRNWGSTDYFDVRSFGAWAHHEGSITAVNCIFIQENPIFSKNFFADLVNHVGQAVNDEGLLALLKPSTYAPGICRGLTATCGGKVSALGCYKNCWWMSVQNADGKMNAEEAKKLIDSFEAMARVLEEML